MEVVNTWIRATLTALLLGVVVWWLTVVAINISVAPITNRAGTITVDQFARAKDILLVVLPMLSIALGYWFGSAGKAAAEERADRRSAQLNEVLDVGGQGLLATAKKNNPQIFGLDDSTAPEPTRTPPTN